MSEHYGEGVLIWKHTPDDERGSAILVSSGPYSGALKLIGPSGPGCCCCAPLALTSLAEAHFPMFFELTPDTGGWNITRYLNVNPLTYYSHIIWLVTHRSLGAEEAVYAWNNGLSPKVVCNDGVERNALYGHIGWHYLPDDGLSGIIVDWCRGEDNHTYGIGEFALVRVRVRINESHSGAYPLADGCLPLDPDAPRPFPLIAPVGYPNWQQVGHACAEVLATSYWNKLETDGYRLLGSLRVTLDGYPTTHGEWEAAMQAAQANVKLDLRRPETRAGSGWCGLMTVTDCSAPGGGCYNWFWGYTEWTLWEYAVDDVYHYAPLAGSPGNFVRLVTWTEAAEGAPTVPCPGTAICHNSCLGRTGYHSQEPYSTPHVDDVFLCYVAIPDVPYV